MLYSGSLDALKLQFASQGDFVQHPWTSSELVRAIWLWELKSSDGRRIGEWAEEPERAASKRVGKLAYRTIAVEHVKAGGYHESTRRARRLDSHLTRRATITRPTTSRSRQLHDP